MILPYCDIQPKLHATCFIAPDATVIGQVEMGVDSSVFFQSVLRADINSIIVGDRVNIQDHSVLHVASDLGVRIGNDVSIGHQCIIHACNLQDNILVGMGSIIMDGVLVGKDSLVGAGSLLPKGKTYPAGSLILGNPARVIRALKAEEIESITRLAQKYVGVKNNYLKSSP